MESTIVDVSYERIRTEVLQALRGSESQQSFSQHLGFEFNKYHKWESGAKRLLWSEFASLCEGLKLPLRETLCTVFCYTCEDLKESAGLVKCLRGFFANETIENLSARIQVSSTVFRRWLNQKGEPTFDDVLALVGLRPNLLESFLVSLVPGHSLPALRRRIELYHRQVEFLAKSPVAPAILAVMSIESYQQLEAHSDEWVANKVGVEPQVVALVVEGFLQSGRMVRKGRQIRPVESRIDLYGQDIMFHLGMSAYYSLRAAKRFSVAKPPVAPKDDRARSFLAYRIVAVSREASAKMRKTMMECMEKIVAIVGEDKGPKVDARAVLLQCFRLDEALEPEDLNREGLQIQKLLSDIDQKAQF